MRKNIFVFSGTAKELRELLQLDIKREQKKLKAKNVVGAEIRKVPQVSRSVK